MKRIIPAVLLLLFAKGAFADSFADLRNELQRKLPKSWVCGEIRSFEGRTLFDIGSPENRYSIVITARDLVTQQDWEARHAKMQKAVEAIVAGIEPKDVDASVLSDAISLPDAWYGRVAMSIGLCEPEVWYEEIESDDVEAKAALNVVLGTVNLYKMSKEGADQPAGDPHAESPVK